MYKIIKIHFIYKLFFFIFQRFDKIPQYFSKQLSPFSIDHAQDQFLFVYLIDNNTKLRGERRGSNSAFNIGLRPLSDKYKNLSNKTAVSTNGANINRMASNRTTLRHNSKHFNTFGCSMSVSINCLSSANFAVANLQYLND